MNVAFDRCQNDPAARTVGGLLHELFEIRNRGLHRFGALKHLGYDQFIVVEQPADLSHPGHQWAVDDVEGRGFFELEL